MALITADRVYQIIQTQGVGPFNVSGTAPAGYRTFAATMAVNDTCYYCCEHQATGEWEVGLGTFDGINGLARTTIYSSSNSGSIVEFSAGYKDIYITLPSEQIDSIVTDTADAAASAAAAAVSAADALLYRDSSESAAASVSAGLATLSSVVSPAIVGVADDTAFYANFCIGQWIPPIPPTVARTANGYTYQRERDVAAMVGSGLVSYSSLGAEAQTSLQSRILWPRDFTNAVWTLDAGLTANSGTGFDGTTVNCRLVNSTGSAKKVSQSVGTWSAVGLHIRAKLVSGAAMTGTPRISNDGVSFTSFTPKKFWDEYWCPATTLGGGGTPTIEIPANSELLVDFANAVNRDYVGPPVFNTSGVGVRTADTIQWLLSDICPNLDLNDCQIFCRYIPRALGVGVTMFDIGETGNANNNIRFNARASDDPSLPNNVGITVTASGAIKAIDPGTHTIGQSNIVGVAIDGSGAKFQNCINNGVYFERTGVTFPTFAAPKITAGAQTNAGGQPLNGLLQELHIRFGKGTPALLQERVNTGYYKWRV